MTKQPPLHWPDDSSSHYEISIRNEYTRFACMFYLFTLLALLTTIFFFILANNSYHNDSESIQRRFIPYSVLALISLTLFSVFFIGSLVYTRKLIKKLRSKQTSNLPIPLPRTIESSTKEKPIESFPINTDEPYSASTKAVARSTNLSYHSCQTDV